MVKKKDSTASIQENLEKSLELHEYYKEQNKINQYFLSDINLINNLIDSEPCFITSYAITIEVKNLDGLHTKVQVFNAQDLDSLLGKVEILKSHIIDLAKEDLENIDESTPIHQEIQQSIISINPDTKTDTQVDTRKTESTEANLNTLPELLKKLGIKKKEDNEDDGA